MPSITDNSVRSRVNSDPNGRDAWIRGAEMKEDRKERKEGVSRGRGTFRP